MLSTPWHKISDGNYKLILAVAVLESTAGIFTADDTRGGVRQALGTVLCKRQGLGPVSRLSFPAQPFLPAALQENCCSPIVASACFGFGR